MEKQVEKHQCPRCGAMSYGKKQTYCIQCGHRAVDVVDDIDEMFGGVFKDIFDKDK